MKQTAFNNMIAKDFKFAGFTGDLILSRYISNNALALHLTSEKYGQIVACSINVPGLFSNEIAIKDYGENDGMLDALMKQNIVHRPHRYVFTGLTTIPIVFLKGTLL